MPNIILEYLKKSVNPGGTPTRLKEWAGFVVWVQTLSLYLGAVIHDPLSWETVLLSFVTVLVWIVWFIRKPMLQVGLLQLIMYTGVLIQIIAVRTTDGEIAGTIYVMAWSMIALLAERREYTNFTSGLSILILVFATLAFSTYMADDHELGSHTSVATFISGVIISISNFYLLFVDYKGGMLKLESMRAQFERLEKISDAMSDILSRNEVIENLLWHVAKRCMPLLDLNDFVIYLYDAKKDKLVQAAAYGEKSNLENAIENPIEISPDQGVVGRCYSSGKAIRIHDTRAIDYYVVDDEERRSELAVPIYSAGKVVGVLDSENDQVGFYLPYHQRLFEVIASFCGIKITDAEARSQMEEAEVARKVAEQFKELDELKNRFISNISHDLKTPLSLIKGPAQQILKRSSEEETAKNAAYILKNTDHLLHMVEQLLQLQRLDHGLKHLYPERFTIAELIEPLAEQFEALAKEKEMDFHVEVISEHLYTDKFKLQQCVQNLLQNAFRYTPRGGSIKLDCYKDEKGLHIQVADSGPGIDKANKEKIFDRFFKTDVNNHEGTGIGLSLVKEYMEMIGGDVSYEPGKDGGAVFTLVLELQIVEVSEAASNIRSDSDNIEIPVVLVVEDHPELNDFIASTLRHSFHIIQAFDGDQAWKLVQEKMPDLILADLMLPGIQGEELVKRVKDHDQLAHIPVVILSSKSKVPDKVELYALGAENYLVKPFDGDELIAIIQNCFDRRRNIQNLFFKNGTSLENNSLNEDSVADNFIQEVLNIIMENLDDNELSGQLLCESLGMGRNKLQRELKSKTGLSPAEFIRSVRLNEAKNLLQNSRMTVSEIAYSVGFNNLSYFTRSFKLQFEILPSEVQREVKV